MDLLSYDEFKARLKQPKTPAVGPEPEGDEDGLSLDAFKKTLSKPLPTERILDAEPTWQSPPAGDVDFERLYRAEEGPYAPLGKKRSVEDMRLGLEAKYGPMSASVAEDLAKRRTRVWAEQLYARDNPQATAVEIEAAFPDHDAAEAYVEQKRAENVGYMTRDVGPGGAHPKVRRQDIEKAEAWNPVRGFLDWIDQKYADLGVEDPNWRRDFLGPKQAELGPTMYEPTTADHVFRTVNQILGSFALGGQAGVVSKGAGAGTLGHAAGQAYSAATQTAYWGLVGGSGAAAEGRDPEIGAAQGAMMALVAPQLMNQLGKIVPALRPREVTTIIDRLVNLGKAAPVGGAVGGAASAAGQLAETGQISPEEFWSDAATWAVLTGLPGALKKRAGIPVEGYRIRDEAIVPRAQPKRGGPMAARAQAPMAAQPKPKTTARVEERAASIKDAEARSAARRKQARDIDRGKPIDPQAPGAVVQGRAPGARPTPPPKEVPTATADFVEAMTVEVPANATPVQRRAARGVLRSNVRDEILAHGTGWREVTTELLDDLGIPKTKLRSRAARIDAIVDHLSEYGMGFRRGPAIDAPPGPQTITPRRVADRYHGVPVTTRPQSALGPGRVGPAPQLGEPAPVVPPNTGPGRQPIVPPDTGLQRGAMELRGPTLEVPYAAGSEPIVPPPPAAAAPRRPSGEAGFAYFPIEEAAAAARGPARSIFGKQTTRLRELAKTSERPEIAEFADTMDEFNTVRSQFQGELSTTGVPAMRVLAKGPLSAEGKALTKARTLEPVPGTKAYVDPTIGMVEGTRTVPADVQPQIDAAVKFIEHRGQVGTREGLAHLSPQAARGNVWPRTWTQEMREALIAAKPSTMADLTREMTAVAVRDFQQNGIPRATLSRLNDWWTRTYPNQPVPRTPAIIEAYIGEYLGEHGKVLRSGQIRDIQKAEFEFSRDPVLRQVPHAIDTSTGARLPMIEGVSARAVQRMMDTGASRLAANRTINPAALARYKEAFQRAGRTDLFEGTMRAAAHGRMTEPYKAVPAPGEKGGEVVRRAKEAMSTARAGMLTASEIANIPEPLGATMRFGGSRRFIDAVKALAADDGTLAEWHQRMGSASPRVVDWSWDPSRKATNVARLTRNVMGESLGKRIMEDKRELLAAEVGRQMVVGYQRRGKISQSDLGPQDYNDLLELERLGLSEADALKLITWSGTPEELAAIGRRVLTETPKRTVMANLGPGEKSMIEESRAGPLAYPFQTYHLGHARRLMSVADDVVRAEKMPRSNPHRAGRVKAAWKKFLKEGVTQVGLGVMSRWLWAFSRYGEEGLKKEWSELTDDPVGYLGSTTLAQTFGGTFVGGMLSSSDRPIEEHLLPVAMVKDAFRVAAGSDRYKDLPLHERAWKAFQRYVPVVKVAQTAAHFVGLYDQKETQAALSSLYKWRERNKPFEKGSFERAHDPAFYEAMKGVSNTLRKMVGNDTPEEIYAAVRDDLRKATGASSPASVARSLRARRFFDDFSREELAGVREFMADDHYRRLREIDTALERLAAGYTTTKRRKPKRR